MNEYLLKQPIFTTDYLMDRGFTFKMIQQLIEDEQIVRVKRGLYANPTRFKNAHEAAFTLFPEACFCTLSAAYVYGYIYHAPKEVMIAASKNESRIKYRTEWLPLSPMYRDVKYYDLGITEITFNGKTFRLTDRERTVLDVIRHRKSLNPLDYQRVIQGYIFDDLKDVDRLICYAIKLRMIKKVQILFDPWIESFTLRCEQLHTKCDKIT